MKSINLGESFERENQSLNDQNVKEIVSVLNSMQTGIQKIVENLQNEEQETQLYANIDDVISDLDKVMTNLEHQPVFKE